MSTFLKIFAGIAFIIIGVLLTSTLWVPLLPERAERAVRDRIPDFFAGDRAPVDGSGSRLPDGSLGTAEPEIVWRIQAYDGTYVTVQPFASTTPSGGAFATSSAQEPPATDVTIGGTDDTLEGEGELPPYLIRYTAEDQSFTISLFREPLGEVRRAAEAEFLMQLGIDERQACKLRYAVLTPHWVNSIQAGKNLGFSFCQGAPKL